MLSLCSFFFPEKLFITGQSTAGIKKKEDILFEDFLETLF